MIKRRRVILLILLLMLIGYGIFASGYTINTELPAVKYRLGDEKNFENILIKIDGTYQRRLFSADIFRGTIYIEGFEFTNESSGFANFKSTLADIHVDTDGYGFYKYIKVSGDGEIQDLMQGNIFIKDKFSMLTMTIMEKSNLDDSISGWNSQTGLMISAPAQSRDEALKIFNSLMKANRNY